MFQLARMGLMGLGRLPGFLFRGTGWRKGAKGALRTEPATLTRAPTGKASYRTDRVWNPKTKEYELPPIPTRRVYDRYPQGTTVRDATGREYGMGGRFTGRYTDQPRYSPLYRTPRRDILEQAGYIRRKPYRSAAWGLGGLGLGGLVSYPFIAGDEEPPIDPSLRMTTPEPWAAPEGILDFAEAEAARAERGEKNIQDMLTKGFLIAAAGGDPSKFFDRGLEVLKASEQYKVDKDYAKVVRAVYKKGDMPKNARDAYDRLAPLVGPEKAAILSGHQLGMEEGKTKEERLWKKIFDMAQYDPESAAAELVAAWGTKRLGNAPVSSDWNIRMEKAREILQGVVSGGVGYPEGVQNIRAASA